MSIQPSNPSGRAVSLLNFFGLTFLLSWLIWVPLALSHFGIGPFSISEGVSGIVRLLGVLMPAVAALILSQRAGGSAAVKTLLSRLKVWRVGWGWWAAATLVQPALLLLTALVYNLFWGNPPVTPGSIGTAAAMIINVFFLLIATLGEEIGWRGVALPGLQAKKTALVSSLILGLLTAVWHIPFWLLLDTFDQFGITYLALNFLMIVPLTLYLTWIFNHTQSSLLMAVALHVTFNIVNTALLPVTLNIGAFSLFIIFQWILALFLIRRLEPVHGGNR